MLGKFKVVGWKLPLAAHCFVQATFTFVISMFVVSWWMGGFLSGVDFVIHFIMDRIKASPKMLGRYKSLSKERGELINHIIVNKYKLTPDVKEEIKSNQRFWWSLGLDQMVHHLTDILIVYLIMR